ncbi:MAG: esterase/lipase [Aeromicrobium sp.]|nr:esterase/lipase [Aeromicrobium sp.]
MSSVAGRRPWNVSPTDLLLEMAAVPASMPVIGKHFESAGSVAAMGVWGAKHAPEFAGSVARSWLTPGSGSARVRSRRSTASVLERSLMPLGRSMTRLVREVEASGLVSADARTQIRRYRTDLPVRFGPEGAHTLDVWRRHDVDPKNAPVMIFVPGGGWILGSRRMQGYGLLSHLAEQGWVCVAIDYRAAPRHPWPAHIEDVKRAIAWVRENIAEYGGDPSFIAIAGTSAGGHLASLAGLTANDPRFQPGFEDVDTSVSAVVGLYGRYDWEDSASRERSRFMNFLEHVVVQDRQHRVPDIFRAASPIAQVREDAPPFYVIHGSADTVIPVEQARDFVDRLSAVSKSTVLYAELPGAGHAFDMVDRWRNACMCVAVERFATTVHARRPGWSERVGTA